MLFTKAFELALQGKAVTREAWIEPFNDVDKLLYPFVLVMPRGTTLSAPSEETAQVIPAAVDARVVLAIAYFLPSPEEGFSNPHFAKFVPSTNKWQIGWSPSSEDLFSNDWLEY